MPSVSMERLVLTVIWSSVNVLFKACNRTGILSSGVTALTATFGEVPQFTQSKHLILESARLARQPAVLAHCQVRFLSQHPEITNAQFLALLRRLIVYARLPGT